MKGNQPIFEKRRLKFIADLVMGQSAPPESINHDGDGLPFLQGCSEFGSIHPTPEKFSVASPKRGLSGDWLMSVRAPVGKLNRADKDYGIGRGLCAVRAIDGVTEPRFLGYALAAAVPELQSHATGSTYDAVAIEDVANMPIGFPPPPKQRAIADFLDCEIAKIDTLIAKQKVLIEAATRKQLGEADAALSLGLGNFDLVSSQVPWLDRTPSHWPFIRAKFLFDERSEAPRAEDGVVTAFRDGQVTLRSNRRSEGYTFAELEVGYQHVRQGDLVIQTMDAFAGAIGVSESDGKCTGEYAVCVPKDERVNNHYYALLLRLMARRGFIYVLCPSVRERAPRYRFVRFADTLLPMPPRAEQDEIVAHLGEIRNKYRLAIARCNDLVRCLGERRAALITAAVTGQLDTSAISTGAARMAVNDNRQAMRVVVGAEIVSLHGSAKSFGRVKLQKLLYLAEVHTGVHELAGNYLREAAGPMARDLLSDTERGMATADYYKTVSPLNEGDGYTYLRLGKAGAHRDQFGALLGGRTDALTKLIDLLKDYDTRAVEAVATLYAVWNDALLDGEMPDEDRIVRGVLEEWHPEKKAKFTPADLKIWLAWMKRNGLVPSGTGARTQLDRLFV